MRNHLLVAALAASLGLAAQGEVQRTYAPDGTLLMEQQLMGDLLRHVAFHSNGQVKEEGWYTESGPDGAWKQYAADGTLLVKGHFTEGVRSGRWLLRDPANGTLVKLVYRNSKLVKGERTSADGTLLAVLGEE